MNRQGRCLESYAKNQGSHEGHGSGASRTNKPASPVCLQYCYPRTPNPDHPSMTPFEHKYKLLHHPFNAIISSQLLADRRLDAYGSPCLTRGKACFGSCDWWTQYPHAKGLVENMIDAQLTGVAPPSFSVADRTLLRRRRDTAPVLQQRRLPQRRGLPDGWCQFDGT